MDFNGNDFAQMLLHLRLLSLRQFRPTANRKANSNACCFFMKIGFLIETPIGG